MNSVMPISVFRAFNAVYGKVGRAASEECVLALLQASLNAYPFRYMERKHERCFYVTGSLLKAD